MDTLPGPSPLRVGFSLGGLPTEIPGGWPGAAAVAKHGLGDPGEPLDVAKVVELGKRGGNSCETHVKLMWNSYETWLVVWNIFLFFHILGIIIPTDYIIFFKMVIAPPTRFFFFERWTHVISCHPPRTYPDPKIWSRWSRWMPWFPWVLPSKVFGRRGSHGEPPGHSFADWFNASTIALWGIAMVSGNQLGLQPHRPIVTLW